MVLETKKVAWEGKWNSNASQMVQRFKETGHPVSTGASALSRAILTRLKGKETIHFTADASKTELLFRITHSINQLSIYGAVSDWCEQFDLRPNEREPTSERSTTEEDSVKKGIPKSVSSQESELFGMNSKDRTSIWKQTARKSSGF